MYIREKRFDVPIYGGRLVVIQTDELKAIEEIYNLESTEGMDGLTFQTKGKDNDRLYVVAFEGKTTPEIIAHESLHLVTMIFKDIHAYLDMENEEPQCYLIGWIAKKIHSHVKLKK